MVEVVPVELIQLVTLPVLAELELMVEELVPKELVLNHLIFQIMLMPE